MRVLLSGLKYTNLSNIQTQRTIDLVIFDKKFQPDEIDRFLVNRIANRTENCSTITLDNNDGEELFDFEMGGSGGNETTCSHSVLGGTFDRLHLAHKLMLSEAALRSNQRITVGVTEENMLYSMFLFACLLDIAGAFTMVVSGKTLWELIEPINKRIGGVRDFLTDICPELDLTIVPITDPFGPTQHDPTIDLIVVSKETVKGGLKVNEGD